MFRAGKHHPADDPNELRQAHLGAWASLTQLGVFFMLLVDGLQPSRWLPVQAACSWQLLIGVFLLLDAFPWTWRPALRDGLRFVLTGLGLVQNVCFAVYIFVSWLTGASYHWYTSKCHTGNAIFTLDARQQAGDTLTIITLLALALWYVFILIGLAGITWHQPLRSSTRINHNRVYTLALVLVYSFLLVALLTLDGAAPNMYLAVGPWFAANGLLLLTPFCELEVRTLNRGIFLRDIGRIMFWLLALAQALCMGAGTLAQLGDRANGIRSCAWQAPLSNGQRASAYASGVLMLVMFPVTVLIVFLLAIRFVVSQQAARYEFVSPRLPSAMKK